MSGNLIGHARVSMDGQDLCAQHGEGEHTVVQLAELFSVSRATVYCALDRAVR